MSRTGRSGLTLVECLVVIAIIAILFGLLVAGVMQIREASLRIESTNNLRQIILAVHHFSNEHQQQLPTIDGKPPNLKISLPAALLPYIEQGSALGQLQANPNQFLLIKTFLSPADPTLEKALAKPEASSYGSNAQVFQSNARIPTSIPDGTSNTIGFAEHYAYCGVFFFGSFITSPGLGNWPHRATFADSSDLTPAIPVPPLTFQVLPRISDCNYRLAQTPHIGGMLVALMDGSTRQISPAINASTYWGAITPDGDEVLDNW